MISLRSIILKIGDRIIIDDLTMSLLRGEFVCVHGESGSGKSVIIDLLLGIRKPSCGFIEIDGIDSRLFPRLLVQRYRQRIGFVPQELQLVAHRTIAENIVLPLQAACVETDTIADNLRNVLRECNVEHIASRLPSQCSGSERAMVAFARSIIHRPSILLIDDLFSKISHEDTTTVFRSLRRLHEQGMTILCTTQDEALATSFGERIVTLRSGRMVFDSAMPSAVSRDVVAMTTGDADSLEGSQRLSSSDHPLSSDLESKPIAREKIAITIAESATSQNLIEQSEGSIREESHNDAGSIPDLSGASQPAPSSLTNDPVPTRRGSIRQGRYIVKEHRRKRPGALKVQEISSPRQGTMITRKETGIRVTKEASDA